MWTKLMLVCAISLPLVACNSDEGDDLDKFMRDSANDMRPKIKPLPEVKPYVALQYNADGTFEGRLLAMDDANNQIVTAALYLGYKDPYNLTDEQFAEIKVKLIDMKKLLLSYFAGFDEGVEIWKKNKIVAMFAMGEIQAKKMTDQGLPIKYIIPKEGSVGWLDTLLLSAGAKEPELAHAWLDFVLQKKIGLDMTKKFAYGNTTSETPGMEYAKNLSFLLPPEDFTKRVNLWNEVKAAI